MESIVIRDAYENNLKHLDLQIALNAFTCVTGCSGCGKSSLVFDTIYAESQRNFLEGMTGNIHGQKLMNKPHVRSIENLRPALSIAQNYYNVNPRSTVGTATEISYYLRSLFALVNNRSGATVSESLFSSNNPHAFCPHCSGLGVELIVSEALLIPDKEKTLRNGGILFFKGTPESKEHKFLEAMCDTYGIDIDKKISQLSREELQLLLYSNERVKYKLSYKEGRRRRRHDVYLQGAVSAIQERISQSNLTDKSPVYSKFMEEVPCRVCNGRKLRPEILQYRVGGRSYDEVENMELTELQGWLLGLSFTDILPEKEDLTSQLIDNVLSKLNALISLNLGYLCLGRSVPSLSGGERQRLRIATQLTCSLKGLIYILDEPCRGLHSLDVRNIIQATRDLILRGNTVISIEHNQEYINAADFILELGPVGGPAGGYLIRQSNKHSLKRKPLIMKPSHIWEQYIEVRDVCFRNIQGQNVRFPVGGITCITGVSGSGKSTLAEVIARCFLGTAGNYCSTFQGNKRIKRVIQVDQAPIGKTPRSTIASYLGIFDEIRNLFAGTERAKLLNLNASLFSMNVKGGRCELCQGTGLQKIELNYLPSSYITCTECGGKRFHEDILSVTYYGKTIHDVLEAPISELVKLFRGTAKISLMLNSMIELGLGYLRLGQMSMNLSGGEAQRIKLAKALGIATTGSNLYILDEPTSGLNHTDIARFVNTLKSLQENSDTILIIEHNIAFIAEIADYIIDFGLLGGKSGGIIAVQGPLEKAFQHEGSSLYRLDIYPQEP